MAKGCKYTPLTGFLQNSEQERVRMTFEELSGIVSLPPSAYIHRPIWANCTTNYATSFQRSWLDAGFFVSEIDLKKRFVVFSRSKEPPKRKSFVLRSAKQRAIPTSYKDEMLLSCPDKLLGLENDEYLMVSLTRNNSKLVEECIRCDPAYQFKAKAIMKARFDAGDFSEEAYLEIIKCIAAENSTRTDLPTMSCLAQYCAAPENGFLSRVEQGDLSVVDDVLLYLVKCGCRKDKSLASKVCRYLNEWKFNDCTFTINDSVVRSVLPYYLAYYHVDGQLWRNKNFDKLSYTDFYVLFSKVREHAQGLNNLELDHLIWYAYKNDGIRSEVAKALAMVL